MLGQQIPQHEGDGSSRGMGEQDVGKEIYTLLIKNGFETSEVVQNALIPMCAKSGRPEIIRRSTEQ